MPLVQSTVINRIIYDSASRILEVVFKHGRRYSYFSVPEQEYRGLLTASSKGAYYNARIRDRYPYWRRPEKAQPSRR